MSSSQSFNIIPTETFKKQAKKLVKKYPSLKNELYDLSGFLKDHPTKGIPLGNNVFKIRIAIKSKKSGKSSGARVITYVMTLEREIYLLTIYDKSTLDNISDKQIESILREIQK
ncbi:MAG: type II toxin-antitoxin system RelE/ParE family toxin [Bacteroidales bacterium]|nr:type II toxin-antitoxin system RelE/ParE family toxin [Bacteroidales bacterium]